MIASLAWIDDNLFVRSRVKASRAAELRLGALTGAWINPVVHLKINCGSCSLQQVSNNGINAPFSVRQTPNFNYH